MTNQVRSKDDWKRVPLNAYVAIGFLVGLVFPVVASVFQTVIDERPLERAEIIEVWMGIPDMIRFGAPFVLGTLFFIVMRSIRLRQRREIEYIESVEAHSAELERKNAQLFELNEALDGLVYTASHDLKTPVVNFQSMIAMLKSVWDQPGSEATVAQIIGRMEHGVERFHETIGGLLDVSRVHQRNESSNEPTSLTEVIHEVHRDLDNILAGKGGKIHFDLAPDLKVLMPKASLQSILQNLLTNSIKYHRPGVAPQIFVTTRQMDRRVAIEVRDQGIGMDLTENKDKLFQMFTRLTNTSEGNGVGLYIVKRTVEAAGGSIEVESQLNEGTTFRIYLPVADSPSAVPAEKLA